MESFFIPALHSVLQEANPKEYEKWQGNCCRQTAIFAVPLLKTLLPEYKWTAWDGWFDDVVYGRGVRYNHAWVFGKGNGKRLLVDLSRQHHERLFIEVKSNSYPRTHPTYLNMEEQSRARLDIEENLQLPEFYTSKPGHEVLRMVRDRMLKMAK